MRFLDRFRHKVSKQDISEKESYVNILLEEISMQTQAAREATVAEFHARKERRQRFQGDIVSNMVRGEKRE